MSTSVNIEDYRRAAERILPRPIFDYLDGGADDEWSLCNNTSAFDDYEFLPQQLNDISEIDLRTPLLGTELSCPVILSPAGMTRLFHHEKELGVAKAATASGYAYALSTMATASLEDVAARCSGPKIFQIYIHRDRGLTKEFVVRARAADYDALCLTVDTPMAGNRERDRRSGFTMPPQLTFESFASFAIHPQWTFHYLFDSDFRLANVAHRVDAFGKGALGVIEYANSQFDRTVTWDDAAEIVDLWGGPFIIKGVLSAEDAERTRQIGASALMISNHGGRQLEGSAAPIDCVRPIRERIGDDLELIVDGGIRRASHVIKSLALGANAVSFGRPYLYALAAGGADGLGQFLREFKQDLRRDLALLGCKSVTQINNHYLARM